MNTNGHNATTTQRPERATFLSSDVVARRGHDRFMKVKTPLVAVARPTRLIALGRLFRLGLPIAGLIALTLIAPRMVALPAATGLVMAIAVVLFVVSAIASGAGLLALGRYFGLQPQEVRRIVDTATHTAVRIALRQTRRR